MKTQPTNINMKNKTKPGCEIKVFLHGEIGIPDKGFLLRVDVGTVDAICFPKGEDGKIIKNIRHRDFMKDEKPYWQHMDDKR